VPFVFSGRPGFVLNSHPTAYDLSNVGTIQGRVDTSSLQVIVSTGRPDVQVTAETPSADGSRHIAVASAALRSDGSFVLYPLSTGTSQYDLVFHGPGIATVIVKAVPVSSGSPSSASSQQFSGIFLTPSTAFTANVATGSPVAPSGAWVGFYQTLPSSGEIPYLIATAPIDPFSGVLAADEALPVANLQFATYASGSLSPASTAPAEGAATYEVAASAPLYGDGPMTTTVAGSANGLLTTFTVAALAMPPTAFADSIAGALSVARPGTFNKGELIVTHDGAVVAVALLDALLNRSQSSLTFLDSIPGGGTGGTYPSGLYYAEAWVWNSSDPYGTLSRQPYGSALDLRTGSASGVTFSIN
jgi:hypothetical protein